MEKWIDTHAHYNHGRFKKQGRRFLEQQTEAVSYIIQVGTNTKSNLETLQLVSLYDFVKGIIGYFPTDTWELEPQYCKDAESNWIVLDKQLTNDKIVGVGEMGLDYNWNRLANGVEGEIARKIQQKWFINQIDLAKKHNLPICVHSRDAAEDTLKIFSKYESLNGVIHCFSYDAEFAKKALDKGLYLGIGGTSTYPSNKIVRDAIKICPLDRILLETDAPYLSPQPVRKETNQSKYIQYVIENIANIKGIAQEVVIEQTNKNAKEVFAIGKEL